MLGTLALMSGAAWLFTIPSIPRCTLHSFVLAYTRGNNCRSDTFCNFALSLFLTVPRMLRQILFSFSVLENIAYGRLWKAATTDEVEAAAKAASAHDFIIGLAQVFNLHFIFLHTNKLM